MRIHKINESTSFRECKEDVNTCSKLIDQLNIKVKTKGSFKISDTRTNSPSPAWIRAAFVKLPVSIVPEPLPLLRTSESFLTTKTRHVLVDEDKVATFSCYVL